MRERWPDTVRMIISGYTDSEDIIAGINDAGIYQYLTKPWQPEQLMQIGARGGRLFRLQQANQQAALDEAAPPQRLRTR